MTGSANQIELALQIRPLVQAEFERVARVFRTAALHQEGQRRTDTEAILEILEEKRSQVMAGTEAGGFIRDWRELNDQVRLLIARDPRHQAICKRRQGKP